MTGSQVQEVSSILLLELYNLQVLQLLQLSTPEQGSLQNIIVSADPKFSLAASSTVSLSGNFTNTWLH